MKIKEAIFSHIEKYAAAGLILFILIFYSVNTYIIKTPLANFVGKECEIWFVRSLQVVDTALSDISLKNLLNSFRQDYPPLYVITASIASRITGKDWVLMNLVNNTLYFFLLLLFSYLLGKEVKNKAVGLLNVLIISLLPFVYASYRMLLIDFALLSVSVMFIYFLVKSGIFAERKQSIFLGLTCGLGLLVKDPFMVFIAGPLLYSMVLIGKKACKRDYSLLFNFYLFTIIALCIASPYYFNIVNLKYIFERPFFETHSYNWYDFQNISLFTVAIFTSELSIPFSICFLIGLYYFIKEDIGPVKIVVFLWVLVPNVILMFIPHLKSPRYLFPQLPVLALVSAFGAYRLTRSRAGQIVFAVVVITGFLQFFDFSYGTKINVFEKQYNEHLKSHLKNPYFVWDYDIDDIDPDPKIIKKDSDIWKSIEESLRDASLKETSIVALPYLAPDIWQVHYLDWFAWFNGLKMDILLHFPKDIPENEIAIYQSKNNIINLINKDIDKIDYLLFISRPDKKYEEITSFQSIRENITYWCHSAVVPFNFPKTYNWDPYAEQWKKILKTFKKSYSAKNYGNITIYILGK